MSFSSATKHELSRLDIENECCALAELASIIRTSGTIQIGSHNKVILKLSTENAAIARRIFTLTKGLYDANINVVVKKNKQLKKNNNYLVIINDREMTRKILEDIGFLIDSQDGYYGVNYKVPKELIENRCCRRAYVRGAFLGGGSINNPEKAYHLEFVTNNKDHGKELVRIINSFGLNAKIVTRKESYVVYIKEESKFQIY